MKGIITFAVALIFVVTALFAVFNTGRLLNVGMDRLLDTGYCRYEPNKEEQCNFNWEHAKDDVAESTSIILVTLPAALLTFRRLKRKYEETV